MNSTWKVSKYLLSDFKNAIIIYYGIILGLAVVMLSTTSRLANQTHGEVNVGGLGFATLVFLFIAGLNCFKTNFRFMQANNVSRKRFFIANVITLLIASAVMAAIDVLITNVLSSIIPYNSFFEQLYKSNFFLAEFIWSFPMLVCAASLGWFITMLYYKCSMLMKIGVSFSPLIFFILLGYINNLTGGEAVRGVTSFFTWLLSMNSLNPYNAAINIIIATAGIMVLCYLLIFRAPVKD